MAVDRKWVIFGFFLLLVFGGYIAANKYWFYPQYTIQIPPPPIFTSPADNPKVVLIKPFEGTLKKIIQHNDSAEIDSAKTGPERNPFLWRGELAPPPPVKITKEVQPVEIPRLGMIMTGDSGKKALLDGKLVTPGEIYGRHMIEDIGPNYVILSGDYGVLKISISTTSYDAPKVDILEVKDPNLLITPVLSEKRGRSSP